MANFIELNSIEKLEKLFEDSKGRIWAGTENAGLNIYDKKTGKFYRLIHRVSEASGCDPPPAASHLH